MDFLTNSLSTLARVPSAVPLGPETLLGPTVQLLVDYVQKHLRPAFIELGAYDIIDLPLNQFAVRFGKGSGPCLALMAYTPTQHNNLMEDPWSGRIASALARGVDEPCVFGQGVSQNKVHQACLLDLARWLIEGRRHLKGTLFLCINNEGRSTHACSDAILDALPRNVDFVIELFNTGLGISLGNRGRVDVPVEVFGQASHSSSPPDGPTVIDTAAEITLRINQLDSRLRQREPSRLGPARSLVYQMVFDPVAPHTLPSYARLTVDRRLVPGDIVSEAVGEVAEALDDLNSRTGGPEIKVTQGVCMLPAEVDPATPAVALLDETCTRELGSKYRGQFISQGAFDAGGPLARGIPTVMFGSGGGDGLLGDDYVRISDAHRESAVLKSFISSYLGEMGTD